MGEALLTVRTPGVGEIRLRRPETRNAIDPKASARLQRSIEECALRSDVRVVLIAGSGGNFCSGLDIATMTELSTTEAEEFVAACVELLQTLERIEKPTIACVRGACLGFGADLATACDVRIAESTSVFAFPGLQWGMVIGARRLAQVIGLGRAQDLMITGRRISADEAHRLGLVTQVTESADFESTVALATTSAARLPQPSYLAWKRSVLGDWEGAFSVVAAARAGFEGEDFRERLARYRAQLRSPRVRDER